VATASLVCTCCAAPLAPGTDVCPRCNTDVQDGERSSRTAKIALVLGLLGIAVMPVVLSIPAVIWALRARRELAADPTLHGSDAASWGLMLGIAGTIAGVVLLGTVVAGTLTG
jgi:uncharacterized paraquat-inducible protein A